MEWSWKSAVSVLFFVLMMKTGIAATLAFGAVIFDGEPSFLPIASVLAGACYGFWKLFHWMKS